MTDQTADVSLPRVFVIEDNPADIRLLREGVDTADADLDLEVISNGQQAVEQLTTLGADSPNDQPDLILLDLNLPGKSGFEVLATVRNETAFQTVPVVIVSSSENREDIKRAYESSANAYVTKPPDPDEYIRMVAAAVEFWTRHVTHPTNE
ncbi:response regulator [Salinibaculum rarum]|uniref:response regulator n=1 Tax=Salinibaculum rarum TaxID=3058903 RepID=UPI00265E37AF|nr:response regulator [Salinibaculum sp. KK48]